MPTPICGPPPMPGAAGWNTDPYLLAALVLGAAATWWLGPRGRPAGGPLGGWLLLAAALVSPLCSMSVALFSLRVTQHLVTTLGAAPLLALALVRLRVVGAAGVALPAAAFAALLWLWHLPVPYAATFAPDGIAYWQMHATLAGSAAWFWAALLRHGTRRPVAAVLAALATAIQMALLGALLTFAPRPLYPVHAPGITAPWGFTPLEDQQLGGLLMWVPGGLIFLLALGASLAKFDLARAAGSVGRGDIEAAARPR